MAVTTIIPTQMATGTGVVLTAGAGTAINTSNTMSIAYPIAGKLFLTIDSNHADTSASFAAGDFASAGLGAFAWEVGDTVIQGMFIDNNRLVDSDGNVVITWATNSAGFITAHYVVD